MTQDQYNQIGVVEGQQAAKTSMDMTYYHDVSNNMYYEVPVGVTYLTDSFGQFSGYRTVSGQVVSVDSLTGIDATQYNSLGLKEGLAAAKTSMVATHVIQGGR